MTDLGHSICDSVTGSMGKMTSTLFRMIDQEDNHHQHHSSHPVKSHVVSDTSQNLSEMNRMMDLMERLNKEKLRLEELSCLDPSKD